MSAAELKRQEAEASLETIEALVEPMLSPKLTAVEAVPVDARAQAESELLARETGEMEARRSADADSWQVISILPRLDAESHATLITEIHECLAIGARRIALDLSQNQFFSLNAIQLCVGLARDLDGDEGRLALVGCSERTKKHFDVYGSLKQITVVRSLAELVSGRATGLVIRPRSSQAPS